MPKWLGAILIGAGVAALLSFGLAFIVSASGAKPDWTTYLPGVFFGAITAYALNNLTGNRRTREADSAALANALTFAPDPMRARLYLVRTGFVGKMAGMNLGVDGREIAQLKSPRFTCIALSPGPHIVRAAFGGGLKGQTNAAELQLNAAASEIIVLHLALAMGAVKNTVRIERVAPDTLRAKMQSMRMTAPDLAEV